MQKKMQKIKPKITISIPSSDQKDIDNCREFDGLYVKPVYSVKNISKSRSKFTFDENAIEPIVKTRRQRRLQQDNQMLKSSLAALKNGAVSAIAQKQQEIDQLRSHIGWQEEIKAIQQQLQELYQDRHELRDQIEQLQQKMEVEKESSMRMLEQKERIIQQLYSELNSVQMHLQNLQKTQQIKSKKLRIIEQENESLFQQLQFQKITHLGLNSTRNDSDTPQNYIFGNEQPQQQETDQKIIVLKEIDIEKIKQLEEKHREQLKQLAGFYQKRIVEMRQMYDRQLFSTPNDFPNKNITENIDFQIPNSYHQTQVNPKKLSYQLINFNRISDCCSITKKNLSKIDSLSMFTINKQPLMSQNKPSTSENKFTKQKGYQILMTEPQEAIKQRGVTQNTNITNSCQSKKQQPQEPSKFNFKTFLFGAVTGGAMTALLCNLIKT